MTTPSVAWLGDGEGESDGRSDGDAETADPGGVVALLPQAARNPGIAASPTAPPIPLSTSRRVNLAKSDLDPPPRPDPFGCFIMPVIMRRRYLASAYTARRAASLMLLAATPWKYRGPWTAALAASLMLLAATP